MKLLITVCAVACLLGSALAASAGPANYVYTSAGELPAADAILRRPDIEGAQVVYNWKRLEPSEGEYDFSAIEQDLAVTDALGKKLFIQIQDRFFSPEARNIPAYLLDDPQYGGGLVAQIEEGKTEGYGWTTMQWNAQVRARYQALLTALAERFDGKIYGINLPKTAIDVTEDRADAGFSCDAYFAAELENMARPVPRSSPRRWSNIPISGPANGRTITITWGGCSNSPRPTISGWVVRTSCRGGGGK